MRTMLLLSALLLAACLTKKAMPNDAVSSMSIACSGTGNLMPIPRQFSEPIPVQNVDCVMRLKTGSCTILDGEKVCSSWKPSQPTP